MTVTILQLPQERTAVNAVFEDVETSSEGEAIGNVTVGPKTINILQKKAASHSIAIFVTMLFRSMTSSIPAGL